MKIPVTMRERVLATAAETPSLTRAQGRRLTAIGTTISVALALVFSMSLAIHGHGDSVPLGLGARLADGWMLVAGPLAWLTMSRKGSTSIRSPVLLRAATWATPVVLLLWLARFPVNE